MGRHSGSSNFLLSLMFILSGCSSTPKPPSANGGIFRQRNEGYSLLYKLMSDESDVGKIFIFKSADDRLGDLVREIGNFCQAAKKQMDEFPKSDNRVEYDVPDLPYAEQHSRDLQADDEAHALLTSSGKDFEQRLIFIQAEAMNYAAHISKGLAEHEDNPQRKDFLEKLSKQSFDYHARLMKLLTTTL